MAIDGLSRISAVNLADRIPVGSSALGGDGSISVAAFLAYIIDNYPPGTVPDLADLPDIATVNLPALNAALAQALQQRQAALVSGSNIKTVGGQSLLGAGDIPANATTVLDSTTSTSTTAAASANTARLLAVQVTSVATTAGNAASLAAQKLDSAAVGVSVAPLVNNLIPSGNLPSFVDDVLEFANFAALPNPGESGKIYVTTSAETVSGTAYPANAQRRWSGSAYVVLVASPGTTDNVVEGSGNKYFTDARANTALAPTLAGYAPARPPVSVAANTALTMADHANRDLELTGSGTPTLSGTFTKGAGLFPFNATGASITYSFLTPMAGRKSTYAPNETASLRFDGMYWRSDDVDVTAAAPVLGTISGTTAADTSSLTFTAASNYVITAIQWQRDGADISGATSAAYAKTSADYGHGLRAKVGPVGLQYLTNVISVVAGTSTTNITDSGTNRTSNTTPNPRSDNGSWTSSNSVVWGTDSAGIYATTSGANRLYADTAGTNLSNLSIVIDPTIGYESNGTGFDFSSLPDFSSCYSLRLGDFNSGFKAYVVQVNSNSTVIMDSGSTFWDKTKPITFSLTRDTGTGAVTLTISGANPGSGAADPRTYNFNCSPYGSRFALVNGSSQSGVRFRSISVQAS